jgi:hypothetical protein
MEHIRARQHGGTDDPANLALACACCNCFKGPNLSAVDPETDQVVQIFNPRTQFWHEHFAFAGLEIIGLTAVGRATVFLLRMNIEDRIWLRAEVEEYGDLDA